MTPMRPGSYLRGAGLFERGTSKTSPHGWVYGVSRTAQIAAWPEHLSARTYVGVIKSHRAKGGAGFSFIELLVLLAIAAIAISFVTLAVGSGSRPDQLKAQAEKLTGLMQLAVEESVLTSKPIGLRFLQEFGERELQFSYEWSVYEDGKWQPLLSHTIFSPEQLIDGSKIDLRLEGRATELYSATAKQEADNENSISSDKEIKYKPDVFFLHSGEVTPAFELDVMLANIDDEYRVEVNPVGQVRLLRRNSKESEWL
ncbi:MAG: GspH/FimT family pseudopilin [Pseudomonadales bacterium]